MTITVTVFKAKCLQLLRQLEKRREPIEVTRNGKVVARILPPAAGQRRDVRPWERLRNSGRLLAAADESTLSESDFDALR